MKSVIFGIGLSLAASSAISASLTEPVAVNVWGRDWVVAPVEDQPGLFSATRLNPDLQPFLGPARTRTSQAARAFRDATGCRPDYNSMVQIITGEFRTKLVCPSK